MFNSYKFLTDNFKDPEALIRFLKSYQAPCPALATATKWFQRGAIPGVWLPLILIYMELENGQPVRLARYLETET